MKNKFGSVLRLCYVCATNMRNNRDYTKKSTKSNPTGIRFDLEKLEFIKLREKLDTNQKVIDFLMNKYWWENKIHNPTYKELPPLNEPIEIPKQQIISIRSFEYYQKARVECETEEEWLSLKSQIQTDIYLSSRQKSLLIN